MWRLSKSGSTMRITSFLAAALALQAAGTVSAVAQPALELSDKQIERLGVRLAPAQAAEYAELGAVPARVIPARSASWAIVAPFAGVVVSIDALPGSKVEKNAPLFTIMSRDYLAAASGLAQALAEDSAARAALSRQKILVAEGIESGASLEAAEARARSAAAMLAEHRRSIENTAPAERGGYFLLTPQAGRVEQLMVSPGDAVEAMASVGIVVSTADLWLEAQLPADLIGVVSAGDRAALKSGETGAVLSAAASIDPRTRSSVLYAEAPAGADLKIGALTVLTLLKPVKEKSLLKIQSAAVIRLNDKDVVFRRTQSGLAPVTVSIESRTGETVTFSGDVRPGDQLAISGLTELKAMALEEAS